MKYRKKTLIGSIIFVIVTGIWFQYTFQTSDVQEEVLSIDQIEDMESVWFSENPTIPTTKVQVTSHNGVEDSFDKNEELSPSDEKKSFKKCCYLCGAVKNPGVYEFEEGERLSDMISQAGGFTKDAAQTYLNLARFLIDGEKIYVPTKDEVKEESIRIEQEGLMEMEHSDVQEVEQTSHGDKININTADEGSLTTLPGIGEAKAKRILSYREEHGGFGSIEEIKNIEGIKDGVFQKIQDLITVQS